MKITPERICYLLESTINHYMKRITIQLKMFHSMQKYLPTAAAGGKVPMAIDEGTTLADLLRTLGVPDQESKIVLINGQSLGVCRKVKTNPVLNEGDTVSIFPPVAGG